MLEIEEKWKCNGCHTCFNICPQNAIIMNEDEKGFKYPTIDKEKCTKCGLCEKKCPILNKKENLKNNPIAYACYNKDEKVREQSSSGGIFSLLAEYILEKNGVVVGAAFDEQFMVKHILIDNKEELKKLRTSKYLQSNIGNIYIQVKELLNNNRTVLFTGTPCQINGLFSYLGKEYENLYTQDIICHGVPSPKVWKKYLEYRKKKDNTEPLKINFREKTEGWKLFSLIFKYSEEKKYEKNQTQDLFMQAFLRDACLRDSCYSCSFKEKNRKSDITLADFWGIQNVLPEMDDDKGTSLVIVNTEKGKKLYEEIKEKTVYKEVDFEKSIEFNKAMYKSAEKPKLVNKFFDNLDKLEFDELVKKYTVVRKPSFIRRVLRKSKMILKNILQKQN